MAALTDDPAMLPPSSTATPSTEAIHGPIDAPALVGQMAQRMPHVTGSFRAQV
jgi:hypothetical protein